MFKFHIKDGKPVLFVDEADGITIVLSKATISNPKTHIIAKDVADKPEGGLNNDISFAPGKTIERIKTSMEKHKLEESEVTGVTN